MKTYREAKGSRYKCPDGHEEEYPAAASLGQAGTFCRTCEKVALRVKNNVEETTRDEDGGVRR